jgi:hypothetical protein
MKILRILILFVVLLSGCNQKYLADKEEELGERKWSILDAAIVAQDNENLSLNLKVKDLVGVEDSINIKEIYRYGFEQENGGIGKDNSNVFLGLGLGCFGCLMVGYEAFEEMMDIKNGFGATGAIGAMLCLSGCLFLTHDWFPKYDKYKRIDSYYIRKNQKYIKSELLFCGKVKVLVEKTGFEKTYYTDEDGNIELSFDEIIPEPTEADSVLNLIIQYEDLVDTVDVEIK